MAYQSIGSNPPDNASYAVATVTAMEVPHEGEHLLAGFELWVPPSSNVFSSDGMPVFDIIGTDAQIVQFPVRPGRQIMCFSGAMAFMSEGLTMECKLAGMGKTFGRLAGGGSLFQITYTNNSPKDGYIGMTPDYPGYV
jgi:Mitochondrial biogenesis AIM24